jgi:steroid delta-isomerase
VVEDPVGTPPLRSSDAILAQGENFVNAFDTVGLYESFIHVTGNEAVAMWTGKAVTKDVQAVTFEGIDLFEFNVNGKITLLRGFWTPPP